MSGNLNDREWKGERETGRKAQRDIFEREMMHKSCMEMHADTPVHDIMDTHA